MSNPFVVDPNGLPHRPLRPWDRPADDDFYVPMDSTQEQFDQFCEEFANPAGLLTAGRIVLVTGDQGCGKTSLIHRCACWIRDELGKKDIRGEIIDLTQDGADNLPIETRMQMVCSRLIDEMGLAELLSDAASRLLAPMRDQPRRVYPQLRRVLGSAVVIVLLPASADLTDEVVEYTKLAREKILFFAESSYDGVAHACQARLPAAPVIYLAVGKIAISDGWAFVDNRLAHSGHSGVPEIDEATVRRMVQDSGIRMSITGLERILSGVFEEAIRDSINRVGYANITDYVFRHPGLQNG